MIFVFGGPNPSHLHCDYTITLSRGARRPKAKGSERRVFPHCSIGETVPFHNPLVPPAKGSSAPVSPSSGSRTPHPLHHSRPVPALESKQGEERQEIKWNQLKK